MSNLKKIKFSKVNEIFLLSLKLWNNINDDLLKKRKKEKNILNIWYCNN